MANQPKNIAQTTHFVSQNRWIILSIGFIFLTYLLSPILTPFLMAMVLAYICDPLVDKLCLIGFGKRKIPRTLATLIVLFGIVILITALVLVIIPLLQKQSVLITERLPLLIDLFHDKVAPWLQAKFGIDVDIDRAEVREIIKEHWQGTRGFIGGALKAAGSKGLALIGAIGSMLLVPVVLFYILRDWDILVAKVGELIPRKWFAKSVEIAKDVDNVVAEFLRGQLSVMLALSIFYSLGLWFAGLDMALSIGLIAGLLSFIPFVGFAFAFILAILLAALQFSSLQEMIPVLVVFGFGQIIESYILTPYLVGDRIGLHPVVVILALLAGGQLFGFAGILLALPVSAAIAVGLTHLKKSYVASDSYLD
jgi:predicted PurR-regulated permease PerM